MDSSARGLLQEQQQEQQQQQEKQQQLPKFRVDLPIVSEDILIHPKLTCDPLMCSDNLLFNTSTQFNSETVPEKKCSAEPNTTTTTAATSSHNWGVDRENEKTMCHRNQKE